MEAPDKIYVNFSSLSDENFEKIIEEDVKLGLDTKSGIYVCFDGATKIYYEGDLAHCYIYEKMFYRHKGFHLEILSIERYDEMVEEMKKYNWILK